jgi:hypothetical protein
VVRCAQAGIGDYRRRSRARLGGTSRSVISGISRPVTGPDPAEYLHLSEGGRRRLSSTNQPVRGGLSAIRYRRSRAAPPRFLPWRSWDATVPLGDPGAGRVVCHGRAGRMSPGLVMAGTGGNPGSPRCWTYEPGFIPGRDGTESVMKNSQRAGSQDDRAGTARMRRWSEEKLSVRLFEVAFVLVLTGALVWAGWFASASQNATWTPVLVSIAVVGAVAPWRRRSWMSRSR